ncbi:MAG TPA: hypothetical protein PKE20_10015, partial [Promineifilum sp.]|nr:hypothetical protein [Promineifilum sp.]
GMSISHVAFRAVIGLRAWVAGRDRLDDIDSHIGKCIADSLLGTKGPVELDPYSSTSTGLRLKYSRQHTQPIGERSRPALVDDPVDLPHDMTKPFADP